MAKKAGTKKFSAVIFSGYIMMKRKISHFVISVYAGPDDKLYAKATSAVRINGSIGVGGGFRTTVGVRQ